MPTNERAAARHVPSEFDLGPEERKLACGCYAEPCLNGRWRIAGQAFLCDKNHRLFEEVEVDG